MLHIKLNVDFVFLPRVSFLWSGVRNSSYSFCRGESGIFSKTILRLRWHVRIAQDTAGRRYRYATTKGYRRGIARWRRGRIEDGSSSLTKFNNTVIEVCDYADAWCTLGYTGCSKTVEAEAVTALSSGSLLLHPRQAGALWGHIEVGDRRLQWHLRQISIWITPPPSSTTSPFSCTPLSNPLSSFFGYLSLNTTSFRLPLSPSSHILCSTLSPRLLVISFRPLRDLLLVRVSIQTRLSERFRGPASTSPNCSVQRSLGSCFREFWEPIFGRLIRNIPLCVQISSPDFVAFHGVWTATIRIWVKIQ